MQNTSIKILIPLLSFGRSGGMRVLSQLANHWLTKGCDVTFAVFCESENPYYPIDANIIWIDKDGNEISSNNSDYTAKNSGIKRVYAIYKFLSKNSRKYDVVLANSNKSSWAVWLGSKAKNFYYIQAYEVEFSSEMTVKGYFKRLTAWITYYLPLIKVVNAKIYLDYKNIKSDYFVPAGLDLKNYYPKNNDKNNYSKEFLIGCIGRKAEWKGSNDVGEAVKILRSRGYNVNFKVAYEPVEYKDHELVKPDGDKNLADFYRSLDVLIAPGHIQLGAIHYPVIEAMACKTPVITTGYFPANNCNSYIVPIKRPDKIADTLIEIINNYEDAIKKAEIAYEEIQQFDWDVVSSK
ncbi:MAG TPA: hypothetical protein DER56_07275, partial [Thermosipho africanus]|nr:hypothetical protein [Thermosipho africanus]